MIGTFKLSQLLSQDRIGKVVTLKSMIINAFGGVSQDAQDKIGNKLTLSVNGEQIASFDDTTFSSGDVGLFAGTFSEPGTDIHFDNFKVTKP